MAPLAPNRTRAMTRHMARYQNTSYEAHDGTKCAAVVDVTCHGDVTAAALAESPATAPQVS